MSRRLIPFDNNSIPTPSEIFGVNYYDDWDFNDTLSLSLTGNLIDQVNSLTGSGRNFSSTLTERPTLTLDLSLNKNVAVFNGSNEMAVPLSTTFYNFLHNTNGQGMVVVVFRKTSGSLTQKLIETSRTVTRRGFTTYISTTNNINHTINSGTIVVTSNTSTNTITNNEWNFLIAVNDNTNIVASEKSDLVVNGVVNNNNAIVAGASSLSASNFLTMGSNAGLTSLRLFGVLQEQL